MTGSVAPKAHLGNAPEPWRIADPIGPLSPLLLASPHSGSVYPKHMTDLLLVDLNDLRRTEDAFVDELFSAATISGCTILTAVYARSYVDLNRDSRELDPAMIDGKPPRASSIKTPRVEAGLGCLPKVGASGREIYARNLLPEEVEHRLVTVYDAYHQKLRSQLNQLRETWGEAFLLDCHSMPSQQPGRRMLPDIVLGDRFGSSCSAQLVSLAERTLRDLGYSVARNTPYAGGYTTRLYGRPKSGLHALQIEINRKLYMDEKRISKNDNFYIIQRDMTKLSEILSAFVRSRSGLPLAAE